MKKTKNDTWYDIGLKIGISPVNKKRALLDKRYNKRSIARETQRIYEKNKILIYDIETALIPVNIFWTGKQYIRHDRLKGESKIITISFKWLNSNKVHALSWDENQSDKKILEKFLPFYNNADLIIGQNNVNFDNKFINARIAKHNLELNTYLKSLDIMKESKSLFRLPSYSLKYLCKYFDVMQKTEIEGISLWDKVQFGNNIEKEESLKTMLNYNINDVLCTEALYLRLKKYIKPKTHIGVIRNEKKFTSPTNGSYNIKLEKTIVTAMGTIQRLMKCKDDDTLYKISNKSYIDWLKFKMQQK